MVVNAVSWSVTTSTSFSPALERPRERLLQYGSRSLTDAEILALIVRTGGGTHSALEIGRSLRLRLDGLGGLSRTDPARLRVPGLGAAKIASLLAAVELGRRLARSELGPRELLREPAAVARYLSLSYARSDQEVMGALFLDSRHSLVAEEELFRGTLDRAAVEPRQILKRGFLCDAAYILLFHTHPSGDPSPSVEDLSFTRRMAEAGDIVGIRLLDHLILGSASRWLSLRERGAW